MLLTLEILTHCYLASTDVEYATNIVMKKKQTDRFGGSKLELLLRKLERTKSTKKYNADYAELEQMMHTRHPNDKVMKFFRYVQFIYCTLKLY